MFSQIDTDWENFKKSNPDNTKFGMSNENTLNFTFDISTKIVTELNAKGYKAQLRLVKETDKSFLPTRWVVEITKGHNKSWAGRVIQNMLLKHEATFDIDMLGLWKSGSYGATTYTGLTHIRIGYDFYKELDEDFIAVLLHESHHAANHLALKKGSPKGLFAELNLTSHGSKFGYDLGVDLYKYFYNFDEIIAFEKEHRQIVSHIKKLKRQKNPENQKKINALTYELQTWNYLHLATQFVDSAVHFTQKALDTLKDKNDSTLVRYFQDELHDNYTAHISLFEPSHPDMPAYDFTIWLPHAKNEADAKAQLLEELQKLLIKLKDRQQRIHSLSTEPLD